MNNSMVAVRGRDWREEQEYVPRFVDGFALCDDVDDISCDMQNESQSIKSYIGQLVVDAAS